ncbi:MAG: IS4 family transposase [Chloroflexota bacterium]
MNATQTYHTLLKKIKQSLMLNHLYRQINLAWLMTGIMLSHSVHTSKIANKMPGYAKRVSRARRFSRFLSNRLLHPRRLYEPIARQLLQAAAKSGQVRLLMDTTKVTASHQLIMVALAFRRRSLPIAWSWVRKPKGHTATRHQEALLSYVQRLIPLNAVVSLAADSEFGRLQPILDQWGWSFALRQKGNYLFLESGTHVWKKINSVPIKRGQMLWFPNVLLTQKEQHPVHLWLYWHKQEAEPWLIATNLPSPQATKRTYKTRMWIEEMFGDFKANGADLEKSCLRHFQRLSRLTFAVSLLYVWLVAFGTAIIKRGQRALVDRADRRDLSVYRIGHDTFERYLINQRNVLLPDIPYFS